MVSWSDTQVVATVASGSLTGIARIEQNGAWSNAFGFWVLPPGSNAVAQITSRRNPVPARYAATQIERRRSMLPGGKVPGSHAVTPIIFRRDQVPGGNTMTLEPSLLNMSVGDTATIQALGANGLPVTGLAWSTSNSNVVSLSNSDPPVLTALAAGHVTIIAGTASADVTVSAGPLPIGTVIWSNPGDGSGVQSIVPAVPSTSGVADVFAFQADGTVQAITSSGTVVWTANVSQGGYCCQPVVPDFQGGLVVLNVDPNTNVSSIYKLDGITGQPYPAYTPAPNSDGTSPGFDGVAVHPDGTIFAVQVPDEYAVPESVIGIDPTTGAQKFSIQLPMEAPGPPLWGDGATQVYGVIIAGDGYAYVPSGNREMLGTYEDNHLRLLRVDSSGAYDNINVYDWTSDISDLFPLEEVGMITNADQGVLLSWSVPTPGMWTPGMAVTTGVDATLVSAPQVTFGAAVVPILQAQDGSFVGTFPDPNVDRSDMIAFDASGNVRWIVPNETPQIATADGGVIGHSGITYDQNGNATGMMAGLPVQSWRGEYVAQGSVESVVASVIPEGDASFWSVVGGNPTGNGTAFVLCPCLLQSLPDPAPDPAPSSEIRKPLTAKDVPPPPPPPGPLGPPVYVLLVGDPGLNTVDCPTDIRHCHNMDRIFMVTAQTMANQLNGQGNVAYPPQRVSSVQDFEAGLTDNGYIDGGVIYIGHGGVIGVEGQEYRALLPGEQSGFDTNISALNVNTLKNEELAPRQKTETRTATITLWACDAGEGGRYSIAQLIANRLKRHVFAPLLGVYFSNDPNVKAPNGQKLPKPNENLPIYPIQAFGYQLTEFCPGGQCPKK